MFVSCSSVRLLLLPGLLVWLCAAPACAQRFAGGQLQAGDSSHQRPVMSPAAEPGPLQSYAIVGAVRQSAVYVSSQAPLPLWRLVEAAGGLEPDAGPTLRIVRNGSSRFQINFDPNHPRQDDLLLPGDIVVVAVRPGAVPAPADPRTTIPVACIGLTDRPVVLPLDPTIVTVNELLRRLMQPAEMARTVRVIDPPLKSQTQELVPGSVVCFDIRGIDRQPLEQAGALPAPVNLDQPAAPATMSQLPARQETPALPLILPSDPPSEGLISASTWIKLPVAAPREPQPLPVSTSGEPANSPVGERMQAAPQGEAIPEFDAPFLPADTTAQGESGLNTSPAVGPAPPPPLELEIPQRGSRQTAFSPSASPATNVLQPSSPVTDDEDQAGSLPRAESSSAGAASQADFGEELAGAPIASSNPAPGNLLPLLGGAAVLLIAGATLSLVWSRWLHAPRGARVVSPTRSSRPVESPSIPHSPVGDLIHGAVPIVEEPVIPAPLWPLHGVVVGHKRIILNSAHDKLEGPHFIKRDHQRTRAPVTAGSAVLNERQLRRSLREALNSTVRTVSSDRADATPPEQGLSRDVDTISRALPRASVPPAPGHRPERDEPIKASASVERQIEMVRPQPSPPQPSASIGPLERALRILASEKRE